ncbi:MAG: S41 family peptidase, partial [Phycisphaerales bacterium]|nr:S41 family peptidase [Phycisphaerales bacterium]
EDWQEDIDFLAENLLSRHPNFFTKHSVEEFELSLARLYDQIDTLDELQIVMELNRVVALGGDAHTNVSFSKFVKEMHRLPIQCVVLKDGVFVSAARNDYRELIGAQIHMIGNTDIHEAIDRVGLLFAHENKSKLITTASSYLTMMPALAAAGIVESFDSDSITLTLKDDLGEREVVLDCSIQSTNQSWANFTQRFSDRLPLMYRKSNGYYQTDYLAGSKTMYLAYNKCRNANDFPMKKLVEFIRVKSDELDAQRIIIDLRMNGGGDETILWPMMKMLEDSERFSDPGDIITLISRYTFSSAMSNAHQLKSRTGAILIGEPTGGKPNHFGQLNSFELPHSKLIIWHSTKWFNKVKDDPDSVYPDILIEFGSDDFFDGQDPILEAALSFDPDED